MFSLAYYNNYKVIMRAINYQKDLRQNIDQKMAGQVKKNNKSRLQTHASEMGKTLETQDSFANHYELSNQFVSPSHMSISQTFNLKTQEVIDLQLESRLETNCLRMDEREVSCFLDEMRMMRFISEQNRRQKLFIQKKIGVIHVLKIKIDELEQKIRRHKTAFEKKRQKYSIKKYSKQKTERLKTKIIDQQMQQLSFQIQRLKSRIRSTKIKTQTASARPNHQRPYIGQHRHAKGNKQGRFPLTGNYFPQVIYQPVPYNMYHTQQMHGLGMQQLNFHPNPYNTDRLPQQNVQANFHRSNQARRRTETTHQIKTNSNYEMEKNRQYLLNLSKQQENCKPQISSTRSKNNKKSNFAKIEQQLQINKLKYFESSEEESFHNKHQKQKELKQQNNKILDHSDCQNWNKSHSDDDFVELLQKSTKRQIDSIKQQNYLKIEKQSRFQKSNSGDERKSRSDKFSNSGVYIMTSSDEKRKQSESQKSENGEIYRRKSIKTKQHLQMLQSPIVLEMSDVHSSVKLSKRSSIPKQGETNHRFLPLLNKQCMLIEEQSEELTSLKNTPNEHITPRNNSRNQKSSTPHNSQNNKKSKIEQVDEEQVNSVRLNQPPKLGMSDDVEIDFQLSKIKLNSESKVSRGFAVASLHKIQVQNEKQDDDILGSICLVGQSKISRMKSSTQKRSTIKLDDEIDQSKYIKTNSQIKKAGVAVNNESEDFFDFSLSQESNIGKKNGKAVKTDRMSGEFFHLKNDVSENYSRYSLGSRQLAPYPIQEDERQHDDYPSSRTKGKTVPL